MKAGDVVRAVKTVECQAINEGTLYVIEKISSCYHGDSGGVIIRNDSDESAVYYKYRFEVVQEAT